MKRENIVREKSFAFAIRIVNLCQGLTEERREYVLSKQLLRSGTAIGALVRESEYAESRSDFVHKLRIALKEANETAYWLDLLFQTKYLSESEFPTIHSDAVELIKILTSIINRANLNRCSAPVPENLGHLRPFLSLFIIRYSLLIACLPA